MSRLFLFERHAVVGRVPVVLRFVFVLFCLIQVSANQRNLGEPTELEVLRAVAHGMLSGGGQRDGDVALMPEVQVQLTDVLTFATDRGGTFDLYRQGGGGQTAVSFVASSGNDSSPAWSPDGQQMLFVSDQDGDYDVYLYEVENGSTRNITNNDAHDLHPSWHPNGDSILFASDRAGQYFQVYRMNLDGTGLRPLGSVSDNHVLFPHYAPDGNRISFMRASILDTVCSWNWDVWLMDANGGDHRRVSEGVLGDMFPTWSPDGTKLLYASCNWALAADLIWHDLNDGLTGNLTPNTTWSSEWYGTYAPDGVTLSYVSDRTGNADVFVQTAGGLVQNMTNHQSDDLAPAWQPAAATGDNVISGRVAGEDGQPLENVVLNNGIGHTAVTNATGFYSFENLPAGDYVITPRWQDAQFSPGQRNVRVPPDAVDQDFVVNACAKATAEVPVLLVTGWAGSKSEEGKEAGLEKDDQLHYFIEWMGERGYVTGCNLFYALETTPQQPLAVNGEIVQQELCRYAAVVDELDSDWQGEFHIIGHSYGGLRARAYLEDGALNGRCANNQSVHVTKLITMGTPHGGGWPDLPLAAFIGARALLQGDEWPAIWEMLPPVRLWQNAISHQPDGTCYYLLGGDARLQWQVFLTTAVLYYYTGYGASVLAAGNDLAVWLDSAHQLTDWGLGLPLNYPDAVALTTPDLHGQIPYVPGLRSFVNPQTTFDEVILPMLREDAGCEGARRQLAPETTALAERRWQGLLAVQQPHTSVGIPLLDVAAGELQAGETVAGSVALTDEDVVSLTLHWSAGELDFVLVDPNGRLIDAQTAVVDNNIEYSTFDTGLGMLANYVVQAPPLGNWQYRITHTDGANATAYRLVSLASTPVAIRSTVPQWVPAQTAVPIVATVSHNNSEAVLNSVVTATIQQFDGTKHEITLLDDGANGDGAADDGIYGGSFAPPKGGSYGIFFQATGTFANTQYRRTATGMFMVAPAKAALSGNQTDFGVREGVLFTKLALNMGVAVAESSRLTLAADLYAGDTFVTQATTTVDVAAGDQIIQLLFDGQAIRDSGMDGPYTVRHMMLLDNEPELLLIEQMALGKDTSFYRYDEFGRLWRGYLPLIR